MYALTLLLALTAQRPDSFAAQVARYITVGYVAGRADARAARGRNRRRAQTRPNHR